LNLVPALREDKREITVNVDGRFERSLGAKEIDAGMVRVPEKPLMTDVIRRDASRTVFSGAARRLRKSKSGAII
jgi:hypothetical protein